MSIFIDKMFINYIAPRLKNFSWLRTDVALCSCPICGDGHRGTRKRFYLYVNKKYGANSYSVDCKNCGADGSFYNFLKDFDSAVFNDYRLDLFREKYGREPRSMFNDIDEETKKDPETDAELIKPSIFGAVPLSELPEDHPCVLYFRSRKLPEKFLSYFLYTDNFKELTSGFKDEEYAKKMPSDARLIIPFYSAFGDLETYQGRSLDPNCKMRYITVKKNDSVIKVFGLDRVDHRKDIRVCEGPIDSLFLENCLAAADADLTKVKGQVYIFDNQLRNKDVCRHITKAIDAGHKVVLFPKSFTYKDLNEAVMAGVTLNSLESMIKENTFQGLKAKLVFNNLKGS